MKDKRNTPCKECPWKKEGNIPGWTGSSSAADFLEDTVRQVPQECHMSVPYNEPGWEALIETDRVAYCAGAAHFLANTCSQPRDPSWAAVVKRLGQNKEVMGSRKEFMDRHDNEFNRQVLEHREQRLSRG